MIIHVILRDAFGTNMARGDLAIVNDVDTERLREWLGQRASFPLLHSTPHPEFPLTIAVSFDGDHG